MTIPNHAAKNCEPSDCREESDRFTTRERLLGQLLLIALILLAILLSSTSGGFALNDWWWSL